ncbi:MAG TPA: amidohydrolase [Candidatus Hydrogenedentes bacterium]|nr:amidohydrolase [Candidatus Hydrogenedentota bacterium]
MFDFNAKLGHWPYRPVRGFDELLRDMDQLGIAQAVVSSLDAVHFFNPQDGNGRLAELVAAHPDRLAPFAVLRPNFTDWEADLERCLDEYGIRGVVLYPNYHGYELTDERLGHLMGVAAQRGFPVCVQSGLEDPRRQYRPWRVDAVEPEAIGAFARAYPEVNVVALGLKFRQPELLGDPLPDNCFFDTSNYEAMGELETAVEQFPPEKILFGTNFPLFTPRANVDKLRLADIHATARTAIEEANARRLLAI